MHSVAEIEEKIRKRYHQPKGVEQFGIEPVPPELKTVRWHDISRLFSALRSIPARCWSAAWPWFRACHSGARSERSPRSAARDHCLCHHRNRRGRLRVARLSLDAHGLWLARREMGALVSAHDCLNVLVRLSDRRGLPRGRGDPGSVDRNAHSLVTVSVIFAILQAIVAIIGYDLLKHLSPIALPFKILILSFVLVLLGTHSDPNYAPSQVFHYAGKPEAGWLLFVTWMNVVAAGVDDGHQLGRFCR